MLPPVIWTLPDTIEANVAVDPLDSVVNEPVEPDTGVLVIAPPEI